MAPAFPGLLEKFISKVFKNALAAAGVEATTMSDVPNFKYTIGPYFLYILYRVT